jgi:hypothetical protein
MAITSCVLTRPQMRPQSGQNDTGLTPPEIRLHKLLSQKLDLTQKANHAPPLAHKNPIGTHLLPTLPAKMPFHPPRELDPTVSESVLIRRQRSGPSVSINSSHSPPPVLAPLYHGAPCPVLSFTSELSQTRSYPRSPRRLPIPPKHVSHSPSTSTSSSSSSSLSLSIQFSPSRPQSVFVD